MSVLFVLQYPVSIYRLTPPTHSIQYCFRCMDLDSYNVLYLYQLEYFYREQMQHLDTRAIEPLPFFDCMCQMLDLVKPQIQGERDWVLCSMGMILSFMLSSPMSV